MIFSYKISINAWEVAVANKTQTRAKPFHLSWHKLLHLYSRFLNQTQCRSATGNLYPHSNFTESRSESAHPTSLQTAAWTLVLPCGFCFGCIKILIDLVLWSPVITWCSNAANGEIAAFYRWSEFTVAGFPVPPTPPPPCKQWRFYNKYYIWTWQPNEIIMCPVVVITLHGIP
jgi:hypothetical protein